MEKSGFSEEQIIGILRKAEGNSPVKAMRQTQRERCSSKSSRRSTQKTVSLSTSDGP